MVHESSRLLRTTQYMSSYYFYYESLITLMSAFAILTLLQHHDTRYHNGIENVQRAFFDVQPPLLEPAAVEHRDGLRLFRAEELCAARQR